MLVSSLAVRAGSCRFAFRICQTLHYSVHYLAFRDREFSQLSFSMWLRLTFWRRLIPKSL